jgi:predicted negative regulator of RcsB-dependent stress response
MEDSIQTTEAYIKILEWLHANRKPLIIGATVVAIAAIVIGLMSWEKSQAEAEADAQLMSIPLVSVQNGQVVSAPATAFMDVAQKHPDTSAGEYGELFGAEHLFFEGKYPEAHQAFSKFIDEHSTSTLIPQAKVGLAACLEGEGKVNEAAQKYQEIVVTYPSEMNIASPAKLTLARLDEQLNKPDQALKYYQDLARIQDQRDPWAAEARERGTLLMMKHPELRPPPQAAPGMGAAPASPLNLSAPPQQLQKPAAPAPAKP